jgi:hypothetical protein
LPAARRAPTPRRQRRQAPTFEPPFILRCALDSRRRPSGCSLKTVLALPTVCLARRRAAMAFERFFRMWERPRSVPGRRLLRSYCRPWIHLSAASGCLVGWVERSETHHPKPPATHAPTLGPCPRPLAQKPVPQLGWTPETEMCRTDSETPRGQKQAASSALGLAKLGLRPSRHVLVAPHTKLDSFVKISATQGNLGHPLPRPRSRARGGTALRLRARVGQGRELRDMPVCRHLCRCPATLWVTVSVCGSGVREPLMARAFSSSKAAKLAMTG